MRKGDLITQHEDTADFLNKYFSSVFTAELDSIIPEPRNLFNGDTHTVHTGHTVHVLQQGLLHIDVSDEKVRVKLEKLNTCKSPGLDEINAKMLFELRDYIYKPLGIIYRATLERGEIPRDWKDVGITPLFKKGKRSDCQNYRPVSLTSIPCKILETIIKEEIIIHLDKYALLSDSQMGFYQESHV